MLRNYLKTAIRSLFRNRFFSAINIFGLAIAMSICMGIIMLVADQMSYDRYNTKSDRIFQVTTVAVNDHDSDGQLNSASTMRLKQELLEQYTGVEKIVRLKRGFGNSWQIGRAPSELQSQSNLVCRLLLEKKKKKKKEIINRHR